LHANSSRDGLVFRTNIDINVVRFVGYNDAKDDPIRQADLLRSHGFFNRTFPFVDTEVSSVDPLILARPETLLPESYDASIGEAYKLSEILLRNPSDSNAYSLHMPVIEFTGMDNFLSINDAYRWVHILEYTRFYQHKFPAFLNRLARMEDATGIFFTQRTSATRDKERMKATRIANHIGFPQRIIVRMDPVALVSISAAIACLNLKPNEHILTALVRIESMMSGMLRITSESIALFP
jgi:hypothetical protein